jgi:hypothetical protein
MIRWIGRRAEGVWIWRGERREMGAEGVPVFLLVRAYIAQLNRTL